MSSSVIRGGTAAGLALLLCSAIALARQDRGSAQLIAPGPIEIFNPVRGRAVILTSRPAGALVAKGEMICELDPRELKDRLAAQQLVVRAAEFE